jgi:hypothetical protein
MDAGVGFWYTTTMRRTRKKKVWMDGWVDDGVRRRGRGSGQRANPEEDNQIDWGK